MAPTRSSLVVVPSTFSTLCQRDKRLCKHFISVHEDGRVSGVAQDIPHAVHTMTMETGIVTYCRVTSLRGFRCNTLGFQSTWYIGWPSADPRVLPWCRPMAVAQLWTVSICIGSWHTPAGWWRWIRIWSYKIVVLVGTGVETFLRSCGRITNCIPRVSR